ncbi:DUF305 domain-containing protein [Rhodococcus phenolicus]|uniref:DUF305 domain-containing protein n=1 Tax=Rhodococcus phenolicus TaxID=263849 RepID=UPI0012E8C971|nr:DUF305 domain-containing protein [Rhodococcus phenolicus]
MSTVRRTMPALAVAALCLVIGVLLGRVCADADADSGTGAAALTDSDIAFAQEMSMHHQQAIGMTDMLGPGAAPDVRALATQIRSSQWREIGILTGWLELAGAPFQPAAHTDPGRHDMPGTASNEELTRLHDAAGPEQETLFLQLMIRHHQGGIDMAAETARDRSSGGACPHDRDRRRTAAGGHPDGGVDGCVGERPPCPVRDRCGGFSRSRRTACRGALPDRDPDRRVVRAARRAAPRRPARHRR